MYVHVLKQAEPFNNLYYIVYYVVYIVFVLFLIVTEHGNQLGYIFLSEEPHVPTKTIKLF